jgi:hypothetical protein
MELFYRVVINLCTNPRGTEACGSFIWLNVKHRIWVMHAKEQEYMIYHYTGQ